MRFRDIGRERGAVESGDAITVGPSLLYHFPSYTVRQTQTQPQPCTFIHEKLYYCFLIKRFPEKAFNGLCKQPLSYDSFYSIKSKLSPGRASHIIYDYLVHTTYKSGGDHMFLKRDDIPLHTDPFKAEETGAMEIEIFCSKTQCTSLTGVGLETLIL